MIVLHFLLDNGVGQNLTAAVLGFALGFVWSKTKYWPLHAIHVHLRSLEQSHVDVHDKLNAHARRHSAHAGALERIELSLKRLEDAPRASAAKTTRPRGKP